MFLQLEDLLQSNEVLVILIFLSLLLFWIFCKVRCQMILSLAKKEPDSIKSGKIAQKATPWIGFAMLSPENSTVSRLRNLVMKGKLDQRDQNFKLFYRD